jgi:hypothetical protein
MLDLLWLAQDENKNETISKLAREFLKSALNIVVIFLVNIRESFKRYFLYA